MKDKFVDKTWLIAWCEQTGIYNLCLTFSIKNENNSVSVKGIRLFALVEAFY